MGDLPTDRELERTRRSRHIAAKRRIQRRYAEKYVSHFPSDEASWRALWAHIRDEMMDDQELFNYTEDVGVELNQMSGHYDVIELEGTDE